MDCNTIRIRKYESVRPKKFKKRKGGGGKGHHEKRKAGARALNTDKETGYHKVRAKVNTRQGEWAITAWLSSETVTAI